MMKILFILLFTFIFNLFVFGQFQKGTINDPDEYSNVRSGKGSEFEVIRRLLKGEIFQYVPEENSDWWFVKTQNGKKGYIHSSRIKHLDESIYKKCKYQNPYYSDINRDPNFIFELDEFIISFCGEIDKIHENKDEVKLWGVFIFNCTEGEELYYLGDFRYCIFRNVNNKLEIIEMETLPAGPNWNWQETTIGKIIIEHVDNDIKVHRIRKLDSKYISQDLVNSFYDYIMKIKQGEIKLNFDEFFESNENENILSKVYVCCLFGDKRFYDILINITQYVGLLVPDGHIAEMQDSYIDYLNRSN